MGFLPHLCAALGVKFVDLEFEDEAWGPSSKNDGDGTFGIMSICHVPDSNTFNNPAWC